ncbi:MAG: glutathione S-transferase family protein [Sneathiella sp.]|nr:glutathione S-transferase family protein [Sneathiella sp.]
MMKIFGTASSKAFRALWMAEEAGIQYEHIVVHPSESHQHAGLLKVNPSGKIPALLDEGFALTESLALTTYIARAYAPDFLPSTLQGEALLLQWTLFAATEIEPPLIAYLHAKGIPFGEVDEEEARLQLDKLHRSFAYLNQSFSSPYLLGDKFTVADLNVASILVWAKIGHVDLLNYPTLNTWLSNCFERATYIQLQARFKEQRQNRKS